MCNALSREADDVSENKIPHKTHINSLYSSNMWRPIVYICQLSHSSTFFEKLRWIWIVLRWKVIWCQKCYFLALSVCLNETANQLPGTFFKGSLMLRFCSFFYSSAEKDVILAALFFPVTWFKEIIEVKSFRSIFFHTYTHYNLPRINVYDKKI